MKKILFILIALLMINIAIAEECTTEIPETISQNTVLCKQEYQIDTTINVNSDIVLDCNKASLIGKDTITAFLLKNTENSQITNCNLANFESGFYLENANNNIIANNKILDSSKQSIYIKNSKDNQIYNNEINTALTYDQESDNDFCVNEEQNTYLNVIGPGCEIPEEIENYITRSQETEILTKIAQSKDTNLDDLKQNYEQTKEKVTIEKTYGNKLIKIKITANEQASFEIYEFIPKETLESTDLIQTDAIIIDKDPLMMWSFTNVKVIDVQYELPQLVKRPKTIVIETPSVEAKDDDLRVIAYDEVEDEVSDSGESLEEDENKKGKSNVNAIFTIVALIILCAIVIYLVKKKW